MSKNKLVRKNAPDIGLVWELLTPGYGLLNYVIVIRLIIVSRVNREITSLVA